MDEYRFGKNKSIPSFKALLLEVIVKMKRQRHLS
jgi:hypothetical protein